MNSCIVTQTHLDYFDPQGGLSLAEKKDAIDLSVAHLRKGNKDAYIILTGHGVEQPHDSTIDRCDHFYGEPLRPMDIGGSVRGMPAQYYFVSLGIKHGKEKGFKYCLKTRTDCLIGIPNILSYCFDIISQENKKLLLTQQTCGANYRMGDCFMYGNIDFLDSIGDMNNSVRHRDGLINTGTHFLRYVLQEDAPAIDDNTGENLLRHYGAFRDVITLNFMDLRWNYNKLSAQDKINILKNNFDFNKFHGGKTNGWHKFDKHGKLLNSGYPFYCSEEVFYDTNIT